VEKTKNCIQCGQIANYKEGNKNGKPWAGYFCSDPSCKHAEWVALKTNEPKPAPVVVKTAGKEINADMMELAYKKDLMCALITAGNIDPKDTFKELWAVVKSG
jgi:hypothetical protein